jgi:hypothetical protein
MPRQVTIGNGHTNVELPNGLSYDAGDVVVLTDAEWDQISSTAVSSGAIVDNGEVDANDLVSVQAAVVAAPAALTSTNAAGANPTQAEFNALRADVTALRTTIANLLTALKGTGKPMASS